MKHIFLSIGILSGASLMAQNAGDALRMSSQWSLGTARAMGLNGSMGAVGGDFSTLSQNPAGLAVYRKSEFTLSPSFSSIRSESNFTNAQPVTATEDFGNRFGFNIGLVANSVPVRSRDWTTLNFGIGVNRVADFNQRFSYNGNSYGSITNRWLQEIDNNQFDEFGSRLAYETYAIFEDSVGTGAGKRYFWNSDFAGSPNAVTQRNETVRTNGGISEMVVSFAGNYRDKLMVGATLGVPFVSYSEERSYEESDPNRQVAFFERLRYNYTANTDGVGINLKLGVIYRPIHEVRLGLAVHTPSFYNLKDSFSANMSYTILKTNGQTATTDAASPDGIYEYQFATPWRVMGSAAFVIGKYGFVNADVELTDYTQPRFFYDVANNDAQQTVNGNIKAQYQPAVNGRVSGELAIGEFRVRGGVGYRTSPLVGREENVLSYSLGVGVRGRRSFIDLAYRNVGNLGTSTYSPYTLPPASGLVPKIDVRNASQQIMLTLGFRFGNE